MNRQKMSVHDLFLNLSSAFCHDIERRRSSSDSRERSLHAEMNRVYGCGESNHRSRLSIYES